MTSPYRALEFRVWDDVTGESIVGTFDPHRVTTSAAIELRPKIDYAMRQLRMTGDFCDELIKIDATERARAHRENMRQTDAYRDREIANEREPSNDRRDREAEAPPQSGIRTASGRRIKPHSERAAAGAGAAADD